MASQTLIEALVAAQAEMPNPPLDGLNPHYKSRFSTLLAVRDTVIPILNKHGIAVVQSFGFDAGAGPVLTTTLLHSSGKLESHAPIPPVPDVQKWAAAVTYIRRISLLAIAGIVGDPDADAEDVVRAPARSVADRSGRPDTSEVDEVKVRKYCKAFRDALADRNDERVLRGHDDLNADPELYTAVNDALEPKERTAVAEAVTRARQERARAKASF